MLKLTPKEKNKLGSKLGFVFENESETKSEAGDSSHDDSHITTSFATSPYPLLLTEVLDDMQENPSQSTNHGRRKGCMIETINDDDVERNSKEGEVDEENETRKTTKILNLTTEAPFNPPNHCLN